MQGLSRAAPWCCGGLGAHGCSGFCCHPTSTQGRPCSACRSLGAVGIMGAACSLPLVPHGDPGHRTLAHRGPCRPWGTRPAPPCFPPPIRDPRAAPAPSANQSPAPILFTANLRGRRGRGQHGRFPASQSAPGYARGGGRGRSPWRAWHRAPEARPALGEGLQVQGCAVGARGQDVGDILPQESGPVDAPGLLLLCGWQDLLRALAIPAASRAAL